MKYSKEYKLINGRDTFNGNFPVYFKTFNCCLTNYLLYHLLHYKSLTRLCQTIQKERWEGVTLTNIWKVLYLWVSGRLSRNCWKHQTDVESVTWSKLIYLQKQLLCLCLTCCGGRQSCCGWWSCGLLDLFLPFLVRFRLFCGTWVFILLVLLLLLLAFIRCSPQPAQKAWKVETQRHRSSNVSFSPACSHETSQESFLTFSKIILISRLPCLRDKDQ